MYIYYYVLGVAAGACGANINIVKKNLLYSTLSGLSTDQKADKLICCGCRWDSNLTHGIPGHLNQCTETSFFPARKRAMSEGTVRTQEMNLITFMFKF